MLRSQIHCRLNWWWIHEYEMTITHYAVHPIRSLYRSILVNQWSVNKWWTHPLFSLYPFLFRLLFNWLYFEFGRLQNLHQSNNSEKKLVFCGGKVSVSSDFHNASGKKRIKCHQCLVLKLLLTRFFAIILLYKPEESSELIQNKKEQLSVTQWKVYRWEC